MLPQCEIASYLFGSNQYRSLVGTEVRESGQFHFLHNCTNELDEEKAALIDLNLEEYSPLDSLSMP